MHKIFHIIFLLGKKLVFHYGFLALLIAIWEILGQKGLYTTTLLPTPSQIAVAWWALYDSGDLKPAALASIRRVVVGFALAAIVAGCIAILMSQFEVVRNNLKPITEFLRPIAPIAWIPLAIFWFGTGDPPAYFIVFIGSFFPILLNTSLGIRNVRENYRGALDAARSFGASWKLIVVDVAWPAAKPSIMTGLRLGLGIGWMSIIAAELAGVQGLGTLIQGNRQAAQYDVIIAVMVTIGLIGLGMNQLLELYIRWTMPWSRDHDSF